MRRGVVYQLEGIREGVVMGGERRVVLLLLLGELGAVGVLEAAVVLLLLEAVVGVSMLGSLGPCG